MPQTRAMSIRRYSRPVPEVLRPNISKTVLTTQKEGIRIFVNSTRLPELPRKSYPSIRISSVAHRAISTVMLVSVTRAPAYSQLSSKPISSSLPVMINLVPLPMVRSTAGGILDLARNTWISQYRSKIILENPITVQFFQMGK